MAGDYNWDALGMKVPSGEPKNARVNVANLAHAIDWVKQHIYRMHGKLITEAGYDPELDRFRFYANGSGCVAVFDRSFIERIAGVLDSIKFLEAVREPVPAEATEGRDEEAPGSLTEDEGEPPYQAY